MQITKTLYVIERDEWRAWLAKHHDTEKDIWLIYYKKQSGEPRIPLQRRSRGSPVLWVDR